MNLLPKVLFPRNDAQQLAEIDRELIREESKIGADLFGPVPKGHARQFFCLDEHTWIWYEEWQEHGRRKTVTTRYEVRPNGILKAQTGKPYQRLGRDEARNLYRAAGLYLQRVENHYQQLLQTA